jgi:hypothetical protein
VNCALFFGQFALSTVLFFGEESTFHLANAMCRFSRRFCGIGFQKWKVCCRDFPIGLSESDAVVIEGLFFSGKTHGWSARTFQCARFRLLRGLVHGGFFYRTNKKGACMPNFRGTKERLAGPE